MRTRQVAVTLFSVQILTALGSAVLAQEATTSTTSSESSYYRRGVGFQGSNVFAPKYKQRLKNWREQIELGAQKGFLKPADVERFNIVLNRLTELDAGLSAKNYPKEETDSMEQDFNAFNVDLTQAMQPAPQPATTPATVTTTKPISTAATVAPPVVPQKTIPTAVKRAAAKAKPAVKARAKRR